MAEGRRPRQDSVRSTRQEDARPSLSGPARSQTRLRHMRRILRPPLVELFRSTWIPRERTQSLGAVSRIARLCRVRKQASKLRKRTALWRWLARIRARARSGRDVQTEPRAHLDPGTPRSPCFRWRYCSPIHLDNGIQIAGYKRSNTVQFLIESHILYACLRHWVGSTILHHCRATSEDPFSNDYP